jgi:hypothetical protein
LLTTFTSLGHVKKFSFELHGSLPRVQVLLLILLRHVDKSYLTSLPKWGLFCFILFEWWIGQRHLSPKRKRSFDYHPELINIDHIDISIYNIELFPLFASCKGQSIGKRQFLYIILNILKHAQRELNKLCITLGDPTYCFMWMSKHSAWQSLYII